MSTPWLVVEFESDRSVGLVPKKDVAPEATIKIGEKVEPSGARREDPS
jgi:hypothetical protein